ncbi:MAG: hypothetical protein KGY53_04115 [Wenzhouxiangellaceae bacterium]|jgi:hypothetical protein|nr:hypothetical protein [Wenzhouxiangellaceae bacterium]
MKISSFPFCFRKDGRCRDAPYAALAVLVMVVRVMVVAMTVVLNGCSLDAGERTVPLPAAQQERPQ